MEINAAGFNRPLILMDDDWNQKEKDLDLITRLFNYRTCEHGINKGKED
jgi:hypothetical protein